jgi:uncharacterized protein YegL
MGMFNLQDDDLVLNPTPRLPLCFCLDISASMRFCIDELNEGLRLFYDEVRADIKLQAAAEVAVVTFGRTVAQVSDFASIDGQTIAPAFSADGATPMGEAVGLALDLLERRKERYKGAGVEYWQPWLVLMTDGRPTDDIAEASRRAAALVERRKLTIFPIGIGNDAGMAALARFSPRRPPVRVEGTRFTEMFDWLARSAEIVPHSTPGTVTPMATGLESWATAS